ncbi:MAG: SDR family oxidoreductase [Gloeocapsa sp. DLM2.Bin57]|nr:MAG: SDR family oxidoreductase [Gloeocapsa sp. DLM2.Bin57]
MLTEEDTILIVGGSRGIGLAVAEYYAQTGVNLVVVSRTTCKYGTWLAADISTQSGIEKIAKFFAGKQLDALLFLGGTWEKNAFTAEYSFLKSDFAEIDQVITVNCLAPIKIVKALFDSLILSPHPRAIFIGSLTALENTASREVANSASKYGLRGAIHALQRELKNSGIGFTVINPGNVATSEVLNDIKTGAFGEQQPIPLEDLIKVINCVLSLSPTSYISEINIVQIDDGAK